MTGAGSLPVKGGDVLLTRETPFGRVTFRLGGSGSDSVSVSPADPAGFTYRGRRYPGGVHLMRHRGFAPEGIFTDRLKDARGNPASAGVYRAIAGGLGDEIRAAITEDPGILRAADLAELRARHLSAVEAAEDARAVLAEAEKAAEGLAAQIARTEAGTSFEEYTVFYRSGDGAARMVVHAGTPEQARGDAGAALPARARVYLVEKDGVRVWTDGVIID